MKREVTRESTLPPFSLDVASLELLYEKLVGLFDSEERLHTTITLNLPDETLTFDSVEELKSMHIPRNARRFSVSLSQWEIGRSIRISSGMFFNFRPSVSATSSSEAWCAGAIETVLASAKLNRRWYHWLHSLPLGVIVLLAFNVPNILAIFGIKDFFRNYTEFALAWLVSVIALTAIWALRPRLFPGATIITNNNESFVRRYAGELSLLLTAISAVLALIGLVTSASDA